MTYRVIEDEQGKRLVRTWEDNVFPITERTHHQNATRNRLVELEQRVSELEAEVERNRTDYDNHLVYGAGAGLATTILFAALVGWLAWLGGLL